MTNLTDLTARMRSFSKTFNSKAAERTMDAIYTILDDYETRIAALETP